MYGIQDDQHAVNAGPITKEIADRECQLAPDKLRIVERASWDISYMDWVVRFRGAVALRSAKELVDTATKSWPRAAISLEAAEELLRKHIPEHAAEVLVAFCDYMLDRAARDVPAVAETRARYVREMETGRRKL